MNVSKSPNFIKKFYKDRKSKNNAIFFQDLMKYSFYTYKSSNTLPKVNFVNQSAHLGMMKRFDKKDIPKVSSSNGWIGYVIKMMDYALYKGNERRKKIRNNYGNYRHQKNNS